MKSLGAFLQMTTSGCIEQIFVFAGNDEQQKSVQNALARITKPSAWGWLRRLIGRH